MRNSKVVDIVSRAPILRRRRAGARSVGGRVSEVMDEYGIELMAQDAIAPADAVVLAVPHDSYLARRLARHCAAAQERPRRSHRRQGPARPRDKCRKESSFGGYERPISHARPDAGALGEPGYLPPAAPRVISARQWKRPRHCCRGPLQSVGCFVEISTSQSPLCPLNVAVLIAVDGTDWIAVTRRERRAGVALFVLLEAQIHEFAHEAPVAAERPFRTRADGISPSRAAAREGLREDRAGGSLYRKSLLKRA